MQQSASQSIRAYRCYLFGGNGHIARAHDIEATSDEEACEFATQMLAQQSDYPAIEVWDRARQVCRIGAKESIRRAE
jgi:hypothetical protein